jgi:hypothetical protein|tara:strand:+ start:130 stop:708 length:579 start_codon:yes stop_codon:yes gene_type:complete
MLKFKLDTPCTLGSFEKHNKVKTKLISLIKDTECDALKSNNDLIHRVDWNRSADKNRKWVKYILPYLQKYFDKCANKIGYEEASVTNLWFQQYNKNGKHGWHTHAENYTGVYYVKFSKDSAKTELINPFSQNKKIIINAKEGDIVMFPSYVIHRAPEQLNNSEKIIISFNINFLKILPELFVKINKLKGKNL